MDAPEADAEAEAEAGEAVSVVATVRVFVPVVILTVRRVGEWGGVGISEDGMGRIRGVLLSCSSHTLLLVMMMMKEQNE